MATPYAKGQIEVIKGIDAGRRVMWSQDDDYFFAVVDGYFGYVVPNKHLILDPEKISKYSSDGSGLLSVLKTDDCKPAQVVGTAFSEGKTLAQLVGNNVTVWADMKYFKQFMGAHFTYSVKSELEPIHIYCDGELYAVCCPVHY